MAQNEYSSAKKFWFICLLGFALALTIAAVTIAGVIARKTEAAILKDSKILENYEKFQEVANTHHVALLSNKEVKKIPEIKQIFRERDTLLQQKYEGCTLKYYATVAASPKGVEAPQLATGAPRPIHKKFITPLGSTSIKVHCSHRLW